MSTTVNSTFSVTTWGYPWPPQMHWLHQTINLSSLTPEILDGLILGDKLKVGISNYSNDILEWVVSFIHSFHSFHSYSMRTIINTMPIILKVWCSAYHIFQNYH